MGMPAPGPGMVEDTRCKCCGLDPESKGLLTFCAPDISPLNLVLALAATWRGFLERLVEARWWREAGYRCILCLG